MNVTECQSDMIEVRRIEVYIKIRIRVLVVQKGLKTINDEHNFVATDGRTGLGASVRECFIISVSRDS